MTSSILKVRNVLQCAMLPQEDHLDQTTNACRHSLRITEDLLLAPMYQDDIRKSDMALIKKALFDFISSCNRNI